MPKLLPPLVVGAMLLGVGSTAGCSAAAPPPPAPGALFGGSAEVLVDAKSVVSSPTVSCQAMPGFTIVTIGDDAAGLTAYVSNSDALSAEFVGIRNLGGFTGSYNPGHGGTDGTATIGMLGSTYQIDGTARGVYATRPNKTTTESFAIKVSC